MTNLSIKNVTKKFGDLTVLNNLSFEVEAGEALVLLGPSGCGKTTLLKLIAGFLQPDSGEISAGDEVLSTPYEMIPTDRRTMSMVFQSYAIWPHLTVFENVSYGLEVRKVAKDEIYRRVIEALELVQLGGLEKRYSTELSGGQQQRVALARAIVVEPSLLLLDEPLSNLDANLRVEMREELADLHKRLGITFVFVTHDQAEAMVLGDRILLMNKGNLIQEGPPDALYETPRTVFAADFIGRSNVFTGQIEGSGSGALKIRTSFGLVTVGEQTDVLEGKTGDVSFCIRPEWVELLEESTTDRENSFSATILKRVYYGRHIHYVVDLAGTEVDIETALSVKLTEGATVAAAFPAKRCVCLEPDR